MDFSVIIPAYQCQDTISETIESIWKSGLKNFEIIIVDDGSTDNTPLICRQLASDYNEIKYVRQVNKGVSAARNYGMDIAAGQYVLFVDADDSIAAGMLTEVVDIIRKDDPDLLIFGMCFDYFRKGKFYKSELFIYPHEGLLGQKEWGEKLKELYEYNALTSACNKVYRKSIITDNNLRFNTEYFLMEDFLFVLNILGACTHVYMYPQKVYCYRQAEKEGNVYKRIKKISNLNDLVRPFELSMEALQRKNRYVRDGQKVLAEMYHMLLEQKIYKADTAAIRIIAMEYFKSPYSTEGVVSELPSKYQQLYKKLYDGQYMRIRVFNLRKQIRHRIAVVVKSVLYRILNFRSL